MAVIELTVYSRQGCSLCEELIEELLPRVRRRARVEVVDIDTDPGLVERYGTRVPVLVAGDRELCHYLLDSAALEAFLGAADP